MSVMVIRKHIPSGNTYTFDMLKNYEFKQRYGHLLDTTQRGLVRGTIDNWNLSTKRTGYVYSIAQW